MYSHIGCICLVFATMCYQMPEMMHNHTSLLLIFLWLFSLVCFQMCVLKPAVYQKAKSHWLHLFHFPPCVLSNASSKLLHLRIHNYALQRFHSVKPIHLVDDWNKNNREYGVFTMRWNLPSGYIITLAALYVSSALGLIFALRSNCNQFKYTPQVLKRLQLLPSHHFIATIDIWASIVQ